MGLDLLVGVYGQVAIWAEPGDGFYQEVDAQFAAINDALTAAGLPEHREPRDPEDWEPWQCRVGWYSELHFLRRVAAHLGANGELPPPFTGEQEPDDDPLLRARYAQGLADRPFEHLIQHGDEGGWYVPVDFPVPLLCEDVEGQVLGSVQRLHAECLRLHDALGIPQGMTAEDDAETFAEADADELPTWQRYSTETYVCLALLRACEVSMQTGCAIQFC